MMTNGGRGINWFVAATLVTAARAALAGEDAPRLDRTGAALRLDPAQPGGPAQPATPGEPGESRETDGLPGPHAAYGTEGTEWILFGGGVAHDFSDNTDLNLNLGYSRFLVDDVEWLLELGTWYHAQEGRDALSINPVMEFRWHFYNKGATSVFLNAGIGVLAATDNVPDLGTGFDFTPRAGIGLTHAIGGDGTRLIAGLRWHHISNARFNGEDRNPSRDAPMLYIQFAVPY